MKKRLIAIVLVFALCGAAIPVCSATDVTSHETVSPWYLFDPYLTLFDSNVRTGPGMNNSVVTTLLKGTTVYLGHESGDWTYVAFEPRDGAEGGYILSDLICLKSACYYTTASSGLALRLAGSTSSSITGYIDYNTFVELLSGPNSSGWAKVRVREGALENYEGWVYFSYLAKYNGIG